MAAQKRPLPPPASDDDDSHGHVAVRRAATSRGGGGTSPESSECELAARQERALPRETRYGGEMNGADISVSRCTHTRITFDAMGRGHL